MLSPVGDVVNVEFANAGLRREYISAWWINHYALTAFELPASRRHDLISELRRRVAAHEATKVYQWPRQHHAV